DIRKARIRYPSLPFGNMYDALLDLAPSMSFILEGYKNHWFRRLLKGRKVSLIRFFYKVASGRVYQALAKSRKGPPLMTLSPEELDALAEADQLGGSYASFENALAAKQLIEWLLNNRETDGFVAIFTSKERELLRNLVSTGITEDSLQKMGIGKPEYLEMLPRLREKVAEYLGICPQ
ncbi:MAG: hypothetical protein KGJ88_13900, partial [Verrucomicrobiota bacterium]|nr:hypothetical protein [Verrucomicrobiota bacterium]